MNTTLSPFAGWKNRHRITYAEIELLATFDVGQTEEEIETVLKALLDTRTW
jgi:hypothetical protein